MDKNTIWAIVLSTLVIIVFMFVIPMAQGKFAPDPVTEAPVEEVAVSEETKTTDSIFSESEQAILAEEKEEEKAAQLINVDIGVADVVLTTKGGDIVSYKLKNHIDKDTNEGVQITDSVTETNRACAIALGTGDAQIIDQVFDFEKVNDTTYRFMKNIKTTDSTGVKKSFILAKTYTFMPGEYMFKLDVLIKCADASGLDLNGAAYTIRTAPQIGPHLDSKNRYDTRQYIGYNGKKAKKIILAGNQFKNYSKEKNLQWGGIAGKYFEQLVIPSDPSIWRTSYYSSKVVNDYSNAQALFERRSFTGSTIEDTYYMYFGPRSESALKIYNIADKNGWNFGGHRLTESLQTSWLSWLEFLLRKALEYMHIVIPNWGLCIIVLTIILKMLMFPLSKKQSMSTLKMQELQPKIQAVQAKYKDDQQKQQQEMSKIYQEAGYNPASGCLPMIFTFLILYAMYSLFNNYFEFRGAMFIPGWIPDLSVGDSVLRWEKDIPVISFIIGNDLRILPIIYVITQILFSVVTQNGGSTAGQNNASMKFMTYGLPVLFFFLFYSAPAGLLLYWITSNVFQMGQQLIINRMMKAKKIQMGLEKPEQKKVLPPKAKKSKK
ncbi:MAG: membrane protein insertase YidC [Treponema sp.]|nr:membrane protein insertase YidC [Treponema sp.]